MRTPGIASWLTTGALCLAAALFVGLPTAPAAAATASGNPTNETCLACHGNPGFSAPGADGKQRALHVIKDKFGKSVHGKRSCVECHADISEIPHKKGVARKVNCVNCHDALWTAAKAANKTAENAELGVVVQRIDHYMKSVHAQANRDHQSRANAICYDCHAPHYVYPTDSPERAEWKKDIPEICGKCHAKELAQYKASVHAKPGADGKTPHAAICSDCHTTHDVSDPSKDAAKLAITKNCGGCHADSLKTYTSTYHGQVNSLGYAYTAKCFDCHGSHSIQAVDDPRSMVHPDKRVQTCQKCHAGASKSFASFEPHGTPHKFSRYTSIWLASKFMLLMVAGTFAFFWSHTALWFLREYKERKERRIRPTLKTPDAIAAKFKGKRFQRFPLAWRVAHLAVAISLMVLTLTGMSVFYADTSWAPVVMHCLGGPKIAAVIHRTFAVVFVSVFVVQLIYLAAHILHIRGRFQWFGPDSIVPRRQDLTDILAMFKWFFGLGPRPVFDRWTYWEKFDYWAPFSVVAFIGICGAMLWFPTATAAFLPGWVFNIATIFHGEGALLSVLFLFTVHFFNNHLRPDKFPLDVVMFTGSMRLEDFKREHRVEYNRLVASGELEKHLVDAPSKQLSLGARILGYTLLSIGMLLLVFVLIGLYGSLTGA